MSKTATPSQALLAWLIRDDDRTFWIEEVDILKLKLVMSEVVPGSEQKIIRAYRSIRLDAKGDMATDDDIGMLILQGLDKWEAKYGTLVQSRSARPRRRE